jgi:predicted P-loop ATPase
MTDDDFRTIMEPLARRFFGEPNHAQSTKTELRFGSNGSKSVDLQHGVWHDHEEGVGGGVLDLVERMTGLHGQERLEWLESNGFMSPRSDRYDRPPRNRIEKIYDYRDESGHILFQVVRLHPKTFRQRRPDPDLPDEWRWNIQGIRQAPYRLPELIEAIRAKRIVFIVEGEKDVDRLWEIGIAATCNAGGAGKWRPEFSQFFVGADVIVIPDNDPQQVNKETGEPMFHPDGRPKLPGQDHARVVCNALAGSAQRVRYLDLAQFWTDMPEKGDVSDWLDRGGGGAEPLMALAERAAQWLRVASSRSKPKPPPGDRPPWFAELRRDDRGRVIPDLANVLIALREEQQLKLAMGFNEMLQHSIVMAEWPHASRALAGEPAPHETTDDDIARLQEWLQRMGVPRIGREIVGQAVEVFARERRFHPVREWLDSLNWDGARRDDRWLFTYFGAEAADDDAIEYVRSIGAKFLIAMVARIFEPGCQADYMLVLEGDQGILKSAACRALAGEWFSDSLPDDITSKDARQHLRGKWLCEVSELAAFLKTEMESLKAFITRREERYRPPFGRHDVMEKRQCLFIGTTNQELWIKDQTGGRRFWPIRCTTIDVEGLREARDQLFAEAVHRYRQGERWWPTAQEEAKFFKRQQEKRQEDDPWFPTIKTHLDTNLLPQTTVSELARSALGFIGDSRIGTAEQRRIAGILKDLGWRQERTNHGRFYVRPSLVTE